MEENSILKIFSGLRWSAFRSISQAVFSLIIPIILARLLLPEDFGLVAMATVFTGISALLLDFGTGAAIIQKQQQDICFQSSVFWFNVLLGFIIWALIIIAAPHIARLYNQAILRHIIYLTSISILLQSMNIVPVALLKKKFDFFSLAFASIIAQFISAITAIVMALNGFGVWSLVYYSLVNTVFFTVILWTRANWKPKLKFQISHINEIFRFSFFLTAAKFLNYFERQADKFIVGYMMGSASLGLYSKAYSFLLKPTKTISGFVNPVVYSSMSEHQNDTGKLKSMYLNTTQALAMVFFPIAITLIIFAEPLVIFVLGNQWIDLIPLVPVFATILLYKPLHKINSEIFKSLGKTDVFFKLWAFFTPLIIIGFLIGSKFGIIGVGLSYAITSFLLFLTSTYIVKRMVNIRLFEIYITLKNVVLRSVILTFFLVICNKIVSINQTEVCLLKPFIIIILGMILYAVMQLIWPLKAFNNFLIFLKIPAINSEK